MATKIVTKNSSTASAVPTTSDLVQGELAVNVADKRLFTEDNGGAIVELGTNPYNFTANHNGSAKLATTSTGIDVTGTASATSVTSAQHLTAGSAYSVLFGDGGERISGNNSSSLLNFFTGATERMRIDSSGKVGIGTTSPSAPLSVVAASGAVPALGAASSHAAIGSGGFGTMIGTKSSGVGYIQQQRFDGTATAYSLALQPNGGNVGINAINPDDGDLQIGDANSAFTIAVAGARTKFGYDGTNAIVQGGLAKGIAFCVNNATLGSGEAMRISSGGNVGIGTSSPASLVSGGSSPVLSIGGTDAVLTTGDKSGSVSFVTNDPSFISTYSDGITGEIASVAESSVGGAYGLAFYTGTTGSAGRNERVRITSAGLVGIGTSSPSYALDVVSSATNNEPLARFSSAGGVRALFNTDSDDDGSLSLYDKSNVAKVLIRSLGDSYLNGGNVYMAATNAGVTSGGFAFVTGSVDYQMIGHATGTPTGNYYIGFRYGSNTIGTITQQGTTGISYNTSSDQRLKENIADADDAGSKIDAIQVRKYDWKADGSHQDYGMIAQELQLVAPEAVSAPEDPEEMMGVDYSKLVPMLIKEIQSLRNRVAQLEE